MNENIKNTLIFFLGKTPKKRFYRLVILIVLIMLLLNMNCGIKDGRVFFEWAPAAKIEVKI